MTTLSSERLHATSIAIGGRAVLLAGGSGTGKSDLALRLIDRGAVLISDDYTLLRRDGDRLIASAPASIAGKLEVRGVGIIALPHQDDVVVALMFDLDTRVMRLPDTDRRMVAGIVVPVIALAALEPSAPLKVERALAMYGMAG